MIVDSIPYLVWLMVVGCLVVAVPWAGALALIGGVLVVTGRWSKR